MKKCIAGCLLIVCCATVNAQDYHYSQFDANPFYINPALSGERENKNEGAQFILNSRAQVGNYSRKTDAYKSISGAADLALNDKYAVNAVVFNNNSSMGRLNYFNFLLGGAYHIIQTPTLKQNQQNLSVGLQLGMQNKTVKPSQFSYDQQYSVDAEDGFDKNLPSGEIYEKMSLYRFTANFGIYYRYKLKNERFLFYSGLSFFNITRANESFQDDYFGTPLRTVVHGGLNFTLNEQITISPMAMYMTQAQGKETNLGILITNKFDSGKLSGILGMSVRLQNALIFHVGVKTPEYTLRLSYDVLTNYTKYYGNQGIELSFAYRLLKPAADNSTIVNPNL